MRKREILFVACASWSTSCSAISGMSTAWPKTRSVEMFYPFIFEDKKGEKSCSFAALLAQAFKEVSSSANPI
jgi:hypothetical protein